MRKIARYGVVFAAVVTAHVNARTQARPADPAAKIEAVYIASIGGGPDKGRFKHPFGIAVARTGEVYVADSGYARIQVFDGNGTFLRMWGTPGSAPGQFNNPWAIAIDGATNVYVADTFNHRIQVFTKDGAFVRMWGSRGLADGQFNRPEGIAVDVAGEVYVADTYNYRIQVFTKDGTFLRKWGSKGKGPGQFLHPKFPGGDGEGPAGIAMDANGDVYVTDPWNFRVQVFTRDGTFVREWGRIASPGGAWNTPAAIALGQKGGYLNTPDGIAIDYTGHVLVVNAGRMSTFGAFNVQKFTAAGEFRQRFGKDGIERGQFDSPTDIAVDAQGNFYVTDTDNNRVQKFSIDGRFLLQWGSTGDGFLRNPSGVAVDAAGNVFVADQGHRRVQKFSASGEFVGKWGTPSYAPAPGRFYHPGRIAIDSGGRIFVTDLSHPMQIFDDTGKFISTWAPAGVDRDDFSTQLAIDRSDNRYLVVDEKVTKFSAEGKLLKSWRTFAVDMAVDADGYLYVADTSDYIGRIRVFAPSGREIARWNAAKAPDGEPSAYLAITVTPGNHVIALDWRNCRVEVFTRTGELLGRWGSCGFGPGRFAELTDVVADRSGKVYLADYTNNCVQVFALRVK